MYEGPAVSDEQKLEVFGCGRGTSHQESQLQAYQVSRVSLSLVWPARPFSPSPDYDFEFTKTQHNETVREGGGGSSWLDYCKL